MTSLYRRDLTTTSGGNVSIKSPDGRIWMTPTGVDKCNVKPEQVCSITPNGEIVGSFKPTSEWKMHFDIYKERDDVNAIVHTHTPSLLTCALSHQLPHLHSFPAVHTFLGDISMVPYRICGSDKLASACAQSVRENPHSKCFLLLNHGVLVVGSSADEAFNRLELLDRIASLYLVSKLHLDYTPLSSIPAAPHLLRESTFRNPQYQPCYEELFRFSKRAYDHHLVTTEHLFSMIDPHQPAILHTTLPLLRLTSADASTASVSETVNGTHLDYHSRIYERNTSVRVIFECLPLYTSALLLLKNCYATDIMPESFIVIGKIKYISKQDASPAFAASCIQEGATVLLIEEYGVMVIGESAMQAYDRLEVLEATSKAVYMCNDTSRGVFGLSAEEIAEVKSRFGCKLIPKG
ncbi:aldolase [Blastocystis sp. ATCC 50177/Nand II]|uniref:Aldolase n=1 Tax=Blastocystis sp. subtype 1 (strain ATCC 50177 / NandII) TaxID=478820 RepID=A0A196SM40_BLAHN|nr:aldolase [Blastocystis sp. ATCC 50177/Nand II]